MERPDVAGVNGAPTTTSMRWLLLSALALAACGTDDPELILEGEDPVQTDGDLVPDATVQPGTDVTPDPGLEDAAEMAPAPSMEPEALQPESL